MDGPANSFGGNVAAQVYQRDGEIFTTDGYHQSLMGNRLDRAKVRDLIIQKGEIVEPSSSNFLDSLLPAYTVHAFVEIDSVWHWITVDFCFQGPTVAYFFQLSCKEVL